MKTQQWGKPYGDRLYNTPDGRRLEMRRRVCRVRFYDVATGEQVGIEQSNVVPAVIYATYMGWRDDRTPDWHWAKLRAEVLAGVQSA